MIYKWILPGVLTCVTAIGMADVSYGQYQGYASSSQYESYAPNRAQLPQWNSASSATSQQPTTNQYTPASTTRPHAYSPSEMPSVNPFSNVRSQQQSAGNYGNASYQPTERFSSGPQYQPSTQYQPPTQYQPLTQYPTATQYQPASQPYNTYSASFGDQQHGAMGGGMAYSAPTQQVAPTPLPNSFYDQPVQSYGSPSDFGCDPKAGGCATGTGIGVRTGWYGSVIGLTMTRSDANNVWLSDDQTDIRDRVLNSNDAKFRTVGGAGITIGHYINCGRNSLQLVYWGLYPGTSTASAYAADTAVGIDTIVHFDGLQYDAGAGAQDLMGAYFFGADVHRVQRSYQVNNLELNLLGHNFTNGCGPLQLGWTTGVRYLQFDDDFLYSSDPNNTVFTGAPEEVHYGINATNSLVGLQFGGQANYCVGQRLNLFANTKVGLFGNHMTQSSRIYGANGQAFVGDPGNPYFGQDVDAKASRNGYSMICDLSVGGNWCVNSCWSVNLGYRAVGISGVALSTNQIPGDFIAALDSIRTVYPNGCVILHGAFAGVTYCY